MPTATPFTITVLKDGTQVIEGLPRSFTAETDPRLVKKFLDLCNENVEGLRDMVGRYEAARKWNFDHPDKRYNQRIFGMMETYLNRLQRQAGIVDT